MLTGDLRNKIDLIWNDFWSGGLANPLQVIEQITYLIFIKRLDEMQELEERKANTLGMPLERRIFPAGTDKGGEPYENLRWSKFKNFEPREMFRIVDEHVFPFLRELNGEGSAYARHMRDARFQIPSPALLGKVVDKLDRLEMGDRDTKGDVYEYMLAKIATAGQNGQFIAIEIVKKLSDQIGFVILPRRWVVERFFAWINRNRRPRRGFRGHHRFGDRLPLRRLRHAARSTPRSPIMSFETDS
jgi:type I restriction-modification system DNA methylase subunit